MNNLKIFALIILVVSFNLNAQTFTIKGTVSSLTGVVRYASVTFVDNNDTSKKYSVLTDTSGNYQIEVITSISSEKNILPTKFKLEQNYPNPFSSSTSIPYKLNAQSDVHVTIYDILGRVVRKFTAGIQTIGTHSILWDGMNGAGMRAATGIYFYRLQAGDESSVKKMVFEAGGSNLLAQMPNINSSSASDIKKVTNVFLQEGNYIVQIDNSANILPAIIPQQFSNVIIQSDTTLNFTVSSQNQATVYLDSTQQIIRGFGAANIIPWRPDMTTAEVNTAFGTGPGQLGFSILRLRIPYTDNVSDFSTNVPSAKLAESLGAIVFATPWTPPPALKSNNNIVGGTLNNTSYAAYATHLKSFADYMASQGAPLYAISIQNEPDANVTYESCYWDATQFLNFCKNNAASIGTKIMMPESENFNHSLSDSTLNDSTAAANVSIIGGHIYGGGIAPYPLAVSKGKEVWMTEHLTTTDAAAYTWSESLPVAKEINDCMNANMSAYIWWYIVRYYGPISDGTNNSGNKGDVTKRGYIMSQYSKFIRPGYYKIKCNGNPQRNIYVTSYRDSLSSKAVIVVLNTNSSPIYQTFSIYNSIMASFTPYTTSVTKNCVQGSSIATTNGSFTAVLESSSITTFVSN